MAVAGGNVGSNGPEIIILDEQLLEEHKHSESDIEEYAKYLGFDLELDRDLFWIAVAGLKAALPAAWKPCKAADSDDIFYFNFETGQSVWDHPCDGFYRRLFANEKKRRVTKALQLSMDPVESGLNLIVTNLAGERVAGFPVPDPYEATFGSVEDELLAQLKLPKGCVARFVLASATLLSWSFRCKSIAEIFALPAREARSDDGQQTSKVELDASDEMRSQPMKVATMVSADVSECGQMRLSCKRLGGEALSSITVDQPRSDTFRAVEKTIRRSLRLPEGTLPKFVLEDGTCIDGRLRSQTLHELFSASPDPASSSSWSSSDSSERAPDALDRLERLARIAIVSAEVVSTGAVRVSCGNCNGERLLSVTIPSNSLWKQVACQMTRLRGTSENMKFALPDGTILGSKHRRQTVSELFCLPEGPSAELRKVAEPSASLGFVELDDVQAMREPTRSELEEYAVWLGLDLTTHSELSWIAREGLNARLPSGWKVFRKDRDADAPGDGADDIFYFNTRTGECTWDHPCDEVHRSLAQEEMRKQSERRLAGSPAAGLANAIESETVDVASDGRA